MHRPNGNRSRDLGTRAIKPSGFVVLALMASACGGATRHASSPQGQTTKQTAASVDWPRLERLVVAELGTVTMVERDGCVVSAKTTEADRNGNDEHRVRCPKAERIQAWFERADRLTAGFVFEPAPEREGSAITLPAAKVLTANGKVMKVTRVEDIQRLSASVKTLAAELAAGEKPAPGPESPAGWQMLRVTGAAHVMFGGAPARGVFEARVSTNGQYMCEFITNVGDAPMRASKSGYLAPTTAARAIDEVLAPFSATVAAGASTYAAAIRGGTEARSNAGSTTAVFERFAGVQEALGDACLPELEAPAAGSVEL